MKTRLQELRRAAGFRSAREFAEHIGMSAGTYTDYEQGRRSFSLDRAWDFADALSCTLDELAGRDPVGPPCDASCLTADEMELVDAYRNSNARGRTTISVVAKLQTGETWPAASDGPRGRVV